MNTPKTYTEQELVFLLKQKNETAFEYLYTNYSNALYVIVLQIVADEEFAKDILQKAFVKIWNSIETYQANKGRIFTWMMNIVRNTAIDFTRSRIGKESGRNFLQDEYVNDSVNVSVASNIDTIGLSKYILQLPEEMKKVINLVYLKGYTHEEAAELLSMPLGTVKTKVRKGLIQLKEIMGE